MSLVNLSPVMLYLSSGGNHFFCFLCMSMNLSRDPGLPWLFYLTILVTITLFYVDRILLSSICSTLYVTGVGPLKGLTFSILPGVISLIMLAPKGLGSVSR